MTIGDRRRQRAALDGLFAELPADAKLTLLAADWDVSPIAEEAGRRRVARRAREAGRDPVGGRAAPRARAARGGRAGAQDRRGRRAVRRPRRGRLRRRRRVGTARGDAGRARPTVGDPDRRGPACRPRSQRAAIDTGGEAIALVLDAFEDSRAQLVDALRPRPGQPALDARGDGEWHLLRTITGGAVWMGRTLATETTADGETAPADAGSPLAVDIGALWDRARLEWHDRDAAEEVAKVLTPLTSLLVLETEQDYRRFGLEVPGPVAMRPSDRQPRAARRRGAGAQRRHPRRAEDFRRRSDGRSPGRSRRGRTATSRRCSAATARSATTARTCSAA